MAKIDSCINPTGFDTDQIYPPMMHRALNCLGSLCLSPFARKIDEKSKQIKFHEIGLKAFFAKHEKNCYIQQFY